MKTWEIIFGIIIWLLLWLLSLPLSICISMILSKGWVLNFIIEQWQWIVPLIILSIVILVPDNKEKLKVENKTLHKIVNIASITSYIIVLAAFLSIIVVLVELASKGAVYLFSGWVPLDEIYDFVTNWWILIWYIPLWIIAQIIGNSMARGVITTFIL